MLKRFGSSKSGNASSIDDVEIESSSSRLEGDVSVSAPPVPNGLGEVDGWIRLKLRFNCSAERGLSVAIPVFVTVVVSAGAIAEQVVTRTEPGVRGVLI